MPNQIKQFLGSLLAKKEIDSAVGIDIGSSAIKVVQIRKKHGKAVLETYGTLSLGPYANQDIGAITNLDTETLTRALIDALRESNVTSKDVAIAIPSSASLIFNIEIPGVVPEKDIPTIIPTEARKYIPVPITEVTLDWSIIPQIKNKDSKEVMPHQIFLAAIHNDTLNKYKEVSSKASLSADFFEIEIFSTIRSSLKSDLSTTMIIDIGASKTKIAIVEYGVVRTFHLINHGSRDISSNISKSLGIPFAKAEEIKREIGLSSNVGDQSIPDIGKLVIDNIFSEVNSAILGYEKKYNKAISKILLSGGGSLMKGVVDEARRTFHSEVELSDPFGKTESPAFLGDVLAESGPEFSVAVGLALRRLQS